MFQILTGFKQIFTSSSNIHLSWEFLLLTHPEDLLVSSQLSMSTKSSCPYEPRRYKKDTIEQTMNIYGTLRSMQYSIWIQTSTRVLLMNMMEDDGKVYKKSLNVQNLQQNAQNPT